jgi:AraC family transcriptional regulator
LRIKEVQRLLARTSLSVTAIASRLGFYDQKHLSAIFKRKVGLTPRVFRRQAVGEGKKV